MTKRPLAKKRTLPKKKNKPKFSVVVEEKHHSPILKAIAKGLGAYNTSKVGRPVFKRIVISIRGRDAEIAGGISAYTMWNWCFVDWLWIDEAARGRGLGTKLLMQAEGIAKKRGAEHIYLDTFTFQGDGFYQKLGYEIFGALDDFPPGHRRLWLKKDLT